MQVKRTIYLLRMPKAKHRTCGVCRPTATHLTRTSHVALQRTDTHAVKNSTAAGHPLPLIDSLDDDTSTSRASPPLMQSPLSLPHAVYGALVDRARGMARLAWLDPPRTVRAAADKATLRRGAAGGPGRRADGHRAALGCRRAVRRRRVWRGGRASPPASPPSRRWGGRASASPSRRTPPPPPARAPPARLAPAPAPSRRAPSCPSCPSCRRGGSSPWRGSSSPPRGRRQAASPSPRPPPQRRRPPCPQRAPPPSAA
mmetsp:Transcript_10517/g.33299  ORF Transcript_10517/g.33299 Transcript_10517/m.33299 type:complete len:257 (-) Transcript_10517:782-1552(-)